MVKKRNDVSQFSPIGDPTCLWNAPPEASGVMSNLETRSVLFQRFGFYTGGFAGEFLLDVFLHPGLE